MRSSHAKESIEKGRPTHVRSYIYIMTLARSLMPDSLITAYPRSMKIQGQGMQARFSVNCSREKKAFFGFLFHGEDDQRRRTEQRAHYLDHMWRQGKITPFRQIHMYVHTCIHVQFVVHTLYLSLSGSRSGLKFWWASTVDH